jgi:Holliday junction DNA helicase RuvA
MYDHLVGEVIEKQTARAVLRVSGVGYEVKVSLTTASTLQLGKQQTLYTILHVVDGMPSLLGFGSKSERELARRVLNVTGVGPAIALSVLSVFTPEEFVGHVVRNDVAMLRKVKGIGQKTAERLCLELRDVVTKLDVGTAPASPALLLPQPAADAIAALITLGFSEKEAKDKVEKVHQKRPDTSTEDLVRAVLQS